MAADHTLILVHGMGKPDKDTFKNWQELLAKHHDAYAPAEDKFNDHFRCVNVNYDSVFEALRKTWQNQIDAILDGVNQLPGNELTKSDLTSLTDDNFFTTHVMDVLLYRFVPNVAENVRAVVNEAILQGIKTRDNPGGKVSVIAYSLGTAVVHDTINQLYWPDASGTPPLSTDQFRFHGIVKLANVSRTLETKWDVYKPFIRAGVRQSPDQKYAATRMLSASHAWDPLVSLRRFKPVSNWPDAVTVAAKRFINVEPSIIQRWNIHDLSHYLDDPHVHIPMYKFLRTEGFISKKQEKDALYTINEKAPIERLDEYRNRLKMLLTGEADFSWKRLISVLNNFGKLVKEFSA